MSESKEERLKAALRICLKHLEDTSIYGHDRHMVADGFVCGAAYEARKALKEAGEEP